MKSSMLLKNTLALLAICMLLAACGGGNKEEAPSSTAQKEQPVPAASPQAPQEAAPASEPVKPASSAEWPPTPPPEQGTPKNGGTLVIGVRADVDYLNEFVSTDASAQDIMEEMLDMTLCRYDENLQLHPNLAESWDLDTAKKSITFHIRKDITWHDGVKTTAKDVKFSLEGYMSAVLGYANKGDFDAVEKIVLVDDYTVRVEFKYLYGAALDDVNKVVMPEHLLGKVELNTEAMRRAAYNENPIGNGPFKFQSQKRNEQLVLVANEKFALGRPHLDRIIFRVIPEETALYTALKTGEIDMMESLPPDKYKEAIKDSKFRVFRYPGRNYTYAGWNSRRSFFGDPKVREAMTYAINRQEIVDTLLRGLGRVIPNPLYSSHWAFNHDIQPHPYDPEKAKEILKAANITDHDGDGILDRDGINFAFTLITNLGNDVREKSGVMIQNYLKKIGIDVKLDLREWTVFLEETSSKNFDAIILGWQLGFVINPRSLFHSEMVEGKFNMTSYSHPEMDRLIDSGRMELDRAKARQIWNDYQQLFHHEQPYTILYERDEVNIVSSKFHGIKMDIRNVYQNIREWWKE